MKNSKRLTLSFGALAALTTPLAAVIACSKDKGELSDIEKQLANVRSIQDSQYSALGLKQVLKTLEGGKAIDPSALGITKDALDPGWNVMYYLKDGFASYQEGNLNIEAKIAHQDNLEKTLAKNVVVRPNQTDDKKPLINHPEQVNKTKIGWKQNNGMIEIAPNATLSVQAIEKLFQGSDDSGEPITLKFAWTEAEWRDEAKHDRKEVPWTATDFSEEGIYYLRIEAKDSSGNKQVLKLEIRVSNLIKELEQIPNMITSSKTAKDLEYLFLNLEIGKDVNNKQLGISFDEDPKYQYDIYTKTEFKNDEITLDFQISNNHSDSVITKVNKEIKLVAGYDFSEITKQLDEMNKVSTKTESDLQGYIGLTSWESLGVCYPTFPQEVTSQVEITSNDIDSKGVLTAKVTLKTGHSQIVKELIIKANQPPTFTLDTKSKIGSPEEGVTAEIIDQTSGFITLPYDSKFTKEQIENLIRVSDDLNEIASTTKKWTKDGEIVSEIDATPSELTTYKFEINTIDSLGQSSNYIFDVNIESQDMKHPKSPHWKEQAFFGESIPFEFDPKNHDFAKVVINESNKDFAPRHDGILPILNQAIKPIEEFAEIDINWITSPYVKEEGYYQLELRTRNNELLSSGKLTLTIEVDVTKPTIEPINNPILGEKILDKDQQKLYVNQPNLVTGENIKALFNASDSISGDLSDFIVVDLNNFDPQKENKEQIIIIKVSDNHRNEAIYQLKIEVCTTKPELDWVENPGIKDYEFIDPDFVYDPEKPDKFEYLTYKIVNNTIEVSSRAFDELVKPNLIKLLKYHDSEINYDYSNFIEGKGGIVKIIATNKAGNKSIIELNVIIHDRIIEYELPKNAAFRYEDKDYEIKDQKVTFPNKFKDLIVDTSDEAEKEFLELHTKWFEATKSWFALEEGLFYDFVFSAYGTGYEEEEYYFTFEFHDIYGNKQEIIISIDFAG